LSRPFRICFAPDEHYPAHDAIAIDCMNSVMASSHVDAFVQAGDVSDCEAISRFVVHSPKKIAEGNLGEEWALASAGLDRQVAASRKVNKSAAYYQLEGNHEARIWKFIDQFPQFSGLFDMPELLGVKANGGKWVPSDSLGHVLRFEWVKPGKIEPVIRDPNMIDCEMRWGVSFIHGWNFSMHNARATADLVPWPGPIVYGDTHTIQHFTSNRWGVDKPWAVTAGWLGRSFPEYIKGRANRWAQGFAEVLMDPDNVGSCDIRTYRIRDGRCFAPDGTIHDGRNYAA
jgi:hypothetical protein